MIKELKGLFKAYFILSILSSISATFNMIIIIYHFGRPGEEQEEMMMMIITSIFLLSNVAWFGFVVLLQKRFPVYMNRYLTDSLFSAGGPIEAKISVWNQIAQQKMERTRQFAAEGSTKIKDKFKKQSSGGRDPHSQN